MIKFNAEIACDRLGGGGCVKSRYLIIGVMGVGIGMGGGDC